jgi:Flp pilus assembly pilin Flp
MKFVRSVLRNQEGVTAIEFAFVGPPFLLLLAAIFELGLTLTSQSLLDGAARDAARLIRTGQAQSQSSPITVFQNLLCSEVSSLRPEAERFALSPRGLAVILSAFKSAIHVPL